MTTARNNQSSTSTADLAATPQSGQVNECLADRQFANGFTIFAPTPIAAIPAGTLRWDGCVGAPVWELAQWWSHYPLTGEHPDRLANGAVRFANKAKWVVVGPPGTSDEGLLLGLDTRPEYDGRARRDGEMWTHLLAQQTIANRCPQLSQLAALRFNALVRLDGAKRYAVAGYNPNLHTIHYQFFVTVQNLNNASAGYGDYLWLGIPVWDERYPTVPEYINGDPGTGKLIYTPAGTTFTTGKVGAREWVRIAADLLPLARASLDEAWRRGFLKDSHDLADYRIGGINLGWEAPGISRAEMRVRELSLQAVVK